MQHTNIITINTSNGSTPANTSSVDTDLSYSIDFLYPPEAPDHIKSKIEKSSKTNEWYTFEDHIIHVPDNAIVYLKEEMSGWVGDRSFYDTYRFLYIPEEIYNYIEDRVIEKIEKYIEKIFNQLEKNNKIEKNKIYYFFRFLYPDEKHRAEKNISISIIKYITFDRKTATKIKKAKSLKEKIKILTQNNKFKIIPDYISFPHYPITSKYEHVDQLIEKIFNDYISDQIQPIFQDKIKYYELLDSHVKVLHLFMYDNTIINRKYKQVYNHLRKFSKILWHFFGYPDIAEEYFKEIIEMYGFDNVYQKIAKEIEEKF